MGRTFSLIALVLALAWVAGVAYQAIATMPHVPLDVSAADPATTSALRAATTRHVIMHGLLALIPAAIVLLIARRINRQ